MSLYDFSLLPICSVVNSDWGVIQLDYLWLVIAFFFLIWFCCVDCKWNNFWQGLHTGSIVVGSISNIDNLVLAFCFIFDFSPLQILNRTNMKCFPSMFFASKNNISLFADLSDWFFFIMLLNLINQALLYKSSQNVYDMMPICFELI